MEPREAALEAEDEDVARERQRVLGGQASDSVLLIENLTKVLDFMKHSTYMQPYLISLHDFTKAL